jgi:hypothetical protein|tara:strand:+ start:530 stop:1108 length:579 start_codon:yes stop_codon:yes gene_type:complete
MNAKTELESILQYIDANIIAADVTLVDSTFVLHQQYKAKNIRDFWMFLDIDYDVIYGEQQLKGIVWLSDGSWLERFSYDGSEQWIHKTQPKIPTQGDNMRTTEEEALAYIIRKTFVLLGVVWPYNTIKELDVQVKRNKHDNLIVLLTVDEDIQEISIDPLDYIHDGRSDQDILYNLTLHALSDQLQHKHDWS